MNTRNSLKFIALLGSVGSTTGSLAQGLVGQWEAYQVTTFPVPFPEYAQRCHTNPFKHASITITSSDSVRFEGTLTVDFGLHVVGASGEPIRNVAHLAERCGLAKSKKSLFAQRTVTYAVTGRSVAGASSAKLNLHLSNCSGDWCDGGPFNFATPQDLERSFHIEGGMLVMDDGKPGLGDDYFHFMPAGDYEKRAKVGERLALNVVQDLRQGNFELAKTRFSDTRYNATLASWFKSVSDDLGKIEMVTTVWRHAMTFPDPADPNEYMSAIIRLTGGGRQTNIVFYVQGPRENPKISYMNGIGYDYAASALDGISPAGR